MHFAVSISKPGVTLNQRIFHVVAYWNWWYSWCNLFESVFDVIYHTIFHSTICSTKSGKYTLLTHIPVWFFLISNLSNFTFLHPTDKGRTNYRSVHAYEICNNMFNRHRRINRFPYTYRFYYLFIVETSSLLHTTKKTSGLSPIKKVEGKLENNESTKSNFG